jgi:hypothetical protein
LSADRSLPNVEAILNSFSAWMAAITLGMLSKDRQITMDTQTNSGGTVIVLKPSLGMDDAGVSRAAAET